MKQTTKLGLGVLVLAGVVGSTACSSSTEQKQTAPAPSTSSFAVRGVIEGFYGKPWSQEQRLDMLSFLGQHHMNTYVYAPKDDPYQRLKWGDLYPAEDAARMKALAKQAESSGVKFVYSISPGLPAPLPGEMSTPAMEQAAITCSSQADREKLAAKVEQLRGLGVHTIMLSFDDVQEKLKSADLSVYDGDLAKAHAELANWLLQTEQARDPQFKLWFAPTTYYGLKDNPYWQTLRTALHEQVQVIWTGEKILSPRITSSQADEVTRLLGRKPLVWDNYPVNDFTYSIQKKPQLFLGPVEGRDTDLDRHTAGWLANPMLQSEASKIALATLGDYLDHPTTYNPDTAWLAAIQALPGVSDPDPLMTFSSYARKSPVHSASNPEFGKKVAAYQANDADSLPLRTELDHLRDLPKKITETVNNQELLTEIEPWLKKLASEAEAGLLALDLAQKAPTDPQRNDLRQQLATKLRTLADDPNTIAPEIIDFAKSLEK
ncbi:beta-N-acetylglucosaminidase domain-containing protein [Tumebacillus sp. ITR2]|uniref:Beta-N-acetylglucosaminidase domain-containing protein n=1 Tax=Tumebacillus amylolyticus TaxID=2801339 RepID=A0ABS1JE94_9BACL|nr:protein O-GlcNAcase [Tumebacillus amylolyticus]MBL0388614.1 beta-N-acetylglucosaminidase domain-containing protein [Tumebacillus amylolyticus]